MAQGPSLDPSSKAELVLSHASRLSFFVRRDRFVDVDPGVRARRGGVAARGSRTIRQQPVVARSPGDDVCTATRSHAACAGDAARRTSGCGARKGAGSSSGACSPSGAGHERCGAVRTGGGGCSACRVRSDCGDENGATVAGRSGKTGSPGFAKFITKRDRAGTGKSQCTWSPPSAPPPRPTAEGRGQALIFVQPGPVGTGGPWGSPHPAHEPSYSAVPRTPSR